MKVDYASVTEISGTKVSKEQVQRMCNRYYWAREYCEDKDVIEAGCGSGQGLGLLGKVSKSLKAGDYCDNVLQTARAQYKDRVELKAFDAQNMPYEDNSADVIILFEAIYYVPDAEKFIEECKRILRDNGHVLIATANKDLFDFNPSPHSFTYYGVLELKELFAKHGFESKFFGDTKVSDISIKQKVLRPVKKLVVGLGLMPKSMKGKELFKKIVFGELINMPEEINENSAEKSPPIAISDSEANREYKVIFCAAQKLATS